MLSGQKILGLHPTLEGHCSKKTSVSNSALPNADLASRPRPQEMGLSSCVHIPLVRSQVTEGVWTGHPRAANCARPPKTEAGCSYSPESGLKPVPLTSRSRACGGGSGEVDL